MSAFENLAAFNEPCVSDAQHITNPLQGKMRKYTQSFLRTAELAGGSAKTKFFSLPDLFSFLQTLLNFIQNY